MADILKYRLPDGTEVEVTSNTSSVTLPFTTPHLDFTVILDQLAVVDGEVRGWYVSSSTYFSPTLSGNYNYRLVLNQGQTRTATFQTVDAKSVSDLSAGRFSSFRDTFSITVTRGNPPADSSADSFTQTFLQFPDSDAKLAIEGNLINITDSNIQFNVSAFDVIDSAYIQARQILGTQDSGFVTGVINEVVDSAFVSLRDRFRDSSFVTGIVDDAYVQARDRIRDSGFVTDIIDSDYISSRQIIGSDSNQIAVIINNIVDSNYISARTQTGTAFDFGTFGAPVSFTLDMGST